MRQFFSQAFAGNLARRRTFPDTFESVTFNPASSEGRAGCRILQQRTPFQVSRLRFRRRRKEEDIGDHWDVTTTNARRLAFFPEMLCVAAPCTIALDNSFRYAVPARDKLGASSMVEFCLEEKMPRVDVEVEVEVEVESEVKVGNDEGVLLNSSKSRGPPTVLVGVWKVCKLQSRFDPSEALLLSPRAYLFEQHSRGPHNYGPARQVYASPFITVVGCSDGESACSRNLHAALYLSNTHAASASTHAPIVRARDLGEEEAMRSNLILIGIPAENSATAALMERLERSGVGPPVTFHSRGDGGGGADESTDETRSVTVGPCTFRGADIGLIFLAPAWDVAKGEARLRLVVAGLGPAGLRHAMALAQPTIPPMMRAPFSNQIPDFMVVDRNVLARGAGGILAAGSWGEDWGWMPEASWWSC